MKRREPVGRPEFHPPPASGGLKVCFDSFFPPFLFSSVLRNRNDSFPVSMMWAWSVNLSTIALQSLALGNIVVHSENGRFVVKITAARSARPATTWKSNSAADSGIVT